jgi:hypothetical protein
LYRVRWKNISWWERIAGAASRTSKPVGELIPERGAARGGQGPGKCFNGMTNGGVTLIASVRTIAHGFRLYESISGDSPELLLVAARCGGREIQPYLHDALTQVQRLERLSIGPSPRCAPRPSPSRAMARPRPEPRPGW